MTWGLRCLFAIKLFIAAMIAFVISVRIGLPQNYWPVVTCCVVSNPLTAGIRSKVVYRFTGTISAGLLSLVIASWFGSVPVLMVIATGLCGTAAFTMGYLERTPRAYGYQLFGLTLMIVIVGSLDHPELTFDTALARVSEISLGIICATAVDTIVLPRSLRLIVHARLRTWLPDMQRWLDDVMSGRGDVTRGGRDRLTVIADMTSLSTLAGQLRYDPMVSRRERQIIFAIQRRMLRLMPIIAAIEARVAGADQDERAVFLPRLSETWQKVRDGEPSAGTTSWQPRADLPAPAANRAWRSLVQQTGVDLIGEASKLWSEVRLLEAAIEGGPLDPVLDSRLGRTAPFPLRPDFHLALRIGTGILLAYGALCTLWLLTGWAEGPGAVLIGIVALAFYGGADEADRAIANYAKFALLAVLLGTFLSYVLLPLAREFASFVLVMGLFMLPLAAWAATNPPAVLLLATVLSNINLQGSYAPRDFGVFLDASIGSLVGIFIAFVCIALVRRLGGAHALERLAADVQRDIVALTYQADMRERDAFLDRTLDRIGQMTARLKAAGKVDQSQHLLARLRAGANIADLRAMTPQTDGDVRTASDEVLTIVRKEIGKEHPNEQLLAAIDRALSAAWQAGVDCFPNPAVRSLVGLRLALFERAPAWEPER